MSKWLTELERPDFKQRLRGEKVLVTIIAITFLVMALIVLLGNPSLNPFFYWHYIPEIISIYGVGILTGRLKFRVWFILFTFLYTITLFTIVSYLVYGSFWGLLPVSFISAPLIVGYWSERKYEG